MLAVLTVSALVGAWVWNGYKEANKAQYRHGLPSGIEISTCTDAELKTHLKWLEIVRNELVAEGVPTNQSPIDKMDREITAIRAEEARRAKIP